MPETREQAWLEERRRRLHLVSVLQALQHDMLGMRHLKMTGDTSVFWTACMKVVDDALDVERTCERIAAGFRP